MLPIIETEEEINNFVRCIYGHKIFAAPILKDAYIHYKINSISAIYIYDLTDNKEFIIGIDHSETLSLDINIVKSIFNSAKCSFILNRKYLSNYISLENCYEASLVNYFTNNLSIIESDYDTKVHDYFMQKYYNLKNVNYLIPIVKHIEKYSNLINSFLDIFNNFLIDNAFLKYNEILDVLVDIESSGMSVDYNIFQNYFPNAYIENNIAFTEYFLFTTTGRPSNRFDSVNYLALNKENGVRKSFNSRFGNDGMLVQFDYDAYHIKLLGNLLGYKFPDNINMHEYLGRQYFGKDTLTEEEYLQSKQVSFRLIYGNIDKEFLSIPFFKLVDDFTKKLWNEYLTNGFILTPIYKRKLYSRFFNDMSSQKLLNYLIQSLEMEVTLGILRELRTFNAQFKSKIILYSYDAILIDFNKNDGGNYLKCVREILSQNFKYPVKIQVGYNFHEMKNVSM